MRNTHMLKRILLRMSAASVLGLSALVVTNPGTVSAETSLPGTCSESAGAKCVSSAGAVYDNMACSGTQCLTCLSAPNRICTGNGTDVADFKDGG